MIAPFDVFGKGLYRYTFIGTCQESPDLKLEDGAVRIFINTNGKNRESFSQEFLDLMEYIQNSSDEVANNSESSKIKLIHKAVKEVKRTEKIGVKAMQKWEEEAWIREDGRIEGREEGRKLGALEMLLSLVRDGKIAIKEAAERAEMKPCEFEKLI